MAWEEYNVWFLAYVSGCGVYFTSVHLVGKRLKRYLTNYNTGNKSKQNICNFQKGEIRS